MSSNMSKVELRSVRNRRLLMERMVMKTVNGNGNVVGTNKSPRRLCRYTDRTRLFDEENNSEEEIEYCPECEEVFDNLETVAEHHKNIHENKKVECPYCKEVFDDIENSLDKHCCTNHQDNGKVKAVKEKKQIVKSLVSGILDDVVQHDYEECPDCLIMVKDSDSLSNHFTDVHAKKVQGVKRKRFTNENNNEQSNKKLKSKRGPGRPKKDQTPSQKAKPASPPNAKPKFKISHKSASRPSKKVRRGENVKFDIKCKTCTECDYTFPTVHSVKTHMVKVHEITTKKDEKIVFVETVKSNDNGEIVELKHVYETCTLGNEVCFQPKKSQDLPFRKMHSPPYNLHLTYYCQGKEGKDCPFESPNHSNSIRHIESVHSAKSKYACDKCHMKFTQKSALTRHVTNKCSPVDT